MRLHVFIPDALVERVDAARGDVPRSRFVVRALEKALGEAEGSSRREQAAPGPVGSAEAAVVVEEPVRAAAPSRAPEPRAVLAGVERMARLNDAKYKTKK